MTNHTSCTHPRTPAGRAECRKARAEAPAPVRRYVPPVREVRTTGKLDWATRRAIVQAKRLGY